MKECSNCGRNDGTHAPGCFRGWTAANAPPTYDELAAENIDLRRQLAEAQAELANSIRIVERKRDELLVADDDFDGQPSE